MEYQEQFVSNKDIPFDSIKIISSAWKNVSFDIIKRFLLKLDFLLDLIRSANAFDYQYILELAQRVTKILAIPIMPVGFMKLIKLLTQEPDNDG